MAVEIEVTDEMRRAVYAADCDEHGHVMDIAHAISNDPHDRPHLSLTTVRGSLPHRLPYLNCRRCQQVWIVVPVSGYGYEEAEAAFRALLIDPDALMPVVPPATTPPDRQHGHTHG